MKTCLKIKMSRDQDRDQDMSRDQGRDQDMSRDEDQDTRDTVSGQSVDQDNEDMSQDQDMSLIKTKTLEIRS